MDWERDYKWKAHLAWRQALDQNTFAALIDAHKWQEIAGTAVRIESRTNLLFSFEKMALRDALKSTAGARAFAEGLFEFLYGHADEATRFTDWCDVVAGLPRKQTRVLTWPLVTVFGFVAQPKKHIFLKPNVTRIAAKEYGFDFHYASRPSWQIYRNYLDFADVIRRELKDLNPRDMIDIQSFLWVQGSDEYEE